MRTKETERICFEAFVLFCLNTCKQSSIDEESEAEKSVCPKAVETCVEKFFFHMKI